MEKSSLQFLGLVRSVKNVLGEKLACMEVERAVLVAVPGSNPGGTTWKITGDSSLLVVHCQRFQPPVGPNSAV